MILEIIIASASYSFLLFLIFISQNLKISLFFCVYYFLIITLITSLFNTFMYQLIIPPLVLLIYLLMYKNIFNKKTKPEDQLKSVLTTFRQFGLLAFGWNLGNILFSLSNVFENTSILEIFNIPLFFFMLICFGIHVFVNEKHALLIDCKKTDLVPSLNNDSKPIENDLIQNSEKRRVKKKK